MLDPYTFAQAVAAAVALIGSIVATEAPQEPARPAQSAQSAQAPDTRPSGWVDTPEGPRCVNGAPCSDEAGNDSSRYTFDWETEPRLGLDGGPTEPMTADEIGSVLDALGYNPETGQAEG